MRRRCSSKKGSDRKILTTPTILVSASVVAVNGMPERPF